MKSRGRISGPHFKRGDIYMETIRTLVLGIARCASPFAMLIARVSAGTIFVESGWGKLHNLEKVTDFFTQLGIPFANIQAPFVAGVELVAGAMVLVGLFARVASVPLIGTMVVAILTAKMSDVAGLSDLFMLSEFLLILVFLWIFTSGAGKFSLDQLVCKRCAGTEPCSLPK